MQTKNKDKIYIRDLKNYINSTIEKRELICIDKGLISTVIHENLEQSLNEIAIKLSILCNYNFDDTVTYLNDEDLYIYEHFYRVHRLPTVEEILWTPGTYECVYTNYINMKNN